ncbi:MAG TPA: hypothetical protein VMC09_06030 [Anaerolineales bacterium]|nr:hypothetical protein [Anaerolineales bacterium]
MIAKLERLAFGLILAPPAPLAGLLLFWWGAYALLPEKWIPPAALSGLLLGILVDPFLLKKLLPRASQLGTTFWAAVFLFYTIGVFGMFMGVPVFNALLAVPAGFVVGAKLATRGADWPQARKAARRTAWFTTAILAAVCAASALLALLSPSTASDLKGLLGLGFEVTPGMVAGLIVIGGLALLAFGWGLALVSVRFSYAFLQQKA